MTVVAHVTTVHPRDDVRVRVKECASLAERDGRDLYLIVADSKGDETSSGLRILDVGRPGGGRAGRFLIGSWRVLREIRRTRPGLVHFHDPELIPVCLLLSFMGYRIVYDVHEDMPRQIPSKHWLPRSLRGLVAGAVGVLERLAARRLDGVVAATPRIAARFPPDRTVLVRNFPRLEEFPRLETVPQCQRPAAFAYVGVIAEIRGARIMSEALDRLPGDVRLRVAGNFSPPDYESAAQTLRGWQKVDMLGWLDRDDVAELLTQVRGGLVILQPLENYVDALPVKLFEYMAAGIPIVASDFPVWRAIVEESGCGLLVDPEKPSAVAEALRWILDHPAEADAMGARGRLAIEARYNWAFEARELEALYERLGA